MFRTKRTTAHFSHETRLRRSRIGVTCIYHDLRPRRGRIFTVHTQTHYVNTRPIMMRLYEGATIGSDKKNNRPYPAENPTPEESHHYNQRLLNLRPRRGRMFTVHAQTHYVNTRRIMMPSGHQAHNIYLRRIMMHDIKI
jgi:hypothetical protein